jgi:hypothetical protein
LGANVWHHFALVLSGGITTLYFDGVAQFTDTRWGPLAYTGFGSGINIGCWSRRSGGGLAFQIDEFRVSNIAQYTANFTPVGPFSNPIASIPASAPNAINPSMMLRWSDDGGFTWSNERDIPIGMSGQYKNRAIARQLGQSRDRVYEVSISDPVPRDIIGATLFAESST